MLTHLRRPFMAGEIPTGEGSVFHFLDIYALGFGLEACGALFLGKSWGWVALGVVGSVFFHLLGTKWSAIKSRLWPGLGLAIERIANDRRYRIASYVLVVGYFIVSGLIYVHTLRSDLDTYVMPRSIADKQANDLRAYLSHHEPHSVTVKFNSLDEEANEYAGEILGVLKEAGWTVDIDATGTQTISVGLCVAEQGENAKPNDPQRDPRKVLQEAIGAAHIDTSCSGGLSSGAGEYKLFLLVGRRPMALGRLWDYNQPMLSRLGHWIERLGEK
jgi:hypothetical protein